MKNYILKKLTIPCVILMLVICMIFSGCASRRSVSAEEFASACEAAGFTLEDSTTYYDPTLVSEAMLYVSEDYSIGYYTFVKSADAKSYYAQFFSSLYAGTSDEKYIDSAEYNRYYASSANAMALLYRNGSTLIHVIGPDGAKLSPIIEDLGI